MKAAAPQAPGSTNTSAKTGVKGLAAPARSADAGAFAGALAKAVAAKAEASPGAAGRNPASGLPAKTTATAKAAGRELARDARQRRSDGASTVERTAVEHPLGRTAAAPAMPAAAATPSPDARTAGQSASGRRAEPRVQVIDLRKRTAVPEAPDTARSETGAQLVKAGASVPAPTTFAGHVAAAETDPGPAPAAHATPLERIREMTGADLAHTVGLVVRDGGGEIRLTLKPESLGSVRIRLSLEDGKVEGRIVVDTPEARRAFEAGIDSLTRALHADGFQTGSLQVSVSGGNGNDSRQAAGLLGDTIAAARLRASDEALQAAVPAAGWTGGGDGLVNVFA